MATITKLCDAATGDEVASVPANWGALGPEQLYPMHCRIHEMHVSKERF